MKNGCEFLRELAEQNMRILQSLDSFLGDDITKEEFREDVEDFKVQSISFCKKVKSLKGNIRERRI